MAAIRLATSTAASDDPLAAFAAGFELDCARGPLENVALRILEAAGEADAVVRINGDSPLLDPALISQAVAMFRADPCDLVSNIVRRSFPKGQSVEILSIPSFREVVAELSDPADQEHVTRFFYRNPDRFRIRSFAAPTPLPELQMSVDTASDFARAESLIAAVDGAPWRHGWRALADRLEIEA